MKILINFFKFIYELKQNFCRRVIIKLDEIISKCSTKEDKEYIDNMLDEAEEIKTFSKKFYENKEGLKLGIDELRRQNEEYKTIIYGLFFHYKNKNYIEMKKIFDMLGLEIIEELDNGK